MSFPLNLSYSRRITCFMSVFILFLHHNSQTRTRFCTLGRIRRLLLYNVFIRKKSNFFPPKIFKRNQMEIFVNWENETCIYVSNFFWISFTLPAYDNTAVVFTPSSADTFLYFFFFLQTNPVVFGLYAHNNNVYSLHFR